MKYCIPVFLISCSIFSPQGLSYYLIVGSSVPPAGLSGSLSKEIISPSSNPSSDLKKTLISCNFIIQNVYFSLLTVFSFPVTFSPKKMILSVLIKVYHWWASESPAAAAAAAKLLQSSPTLCDPVVFQLLKLHIFSEHTITSSLIRLAPKLIPLDLSKAALSNPHLILSTIF